MLLECGVGEDACWADFDQVSGELAFEDTVFGASEVDVVAKAKCIQVVSARVLTIEAYAALALDAAVHLVIDERTKVLIAECSFAEAVGAHAVTGHHRHVL